MKKDTITKKKLDLNTAEQAHGRVETKSFTRLEQIWGDDGFWKYNTLDRGQYEDLLKNMNTAELRNHASKLGVMPVASRDRLLKRLVIEFAKHAAIYKSNPLTVSKQGTTKVAGSKREVSTAALKIMSECK
jgi:hypothetical protein